MNRNEETDGRGLLSERGTSTGFIADRPWDFYAIKVNFEMILMCMEDIQGSGTLFNAQSAIYGDEGPGLHGVH